MNRYYLDFVDGEGCHIEHRDVSKTRMLDFATHLKEGETLYVRRIK